MVPALPLTIVKLSKSFSFSSEFLFFTVFFPTLISQIYYGSCLGNNNNTYLLMGL